MRKIISLLLVLCIALSFTMVAFAAPKKLGEDCEILENFKKNEIKVYLNGKKIDFYEEPRIVNGRTLAPVRQVFEAIGLDVGYYYQTGEITGKNDKFDIKMKVESTEILANGETIYCDVPPMIINGNTMIPVAILAKIIGCKADWYGEIKTVSITPIDEEVKMVEIYNPQAVKVSVPENILSAFYVYGWNEDVNYIGTQMFNIYTGYSYTVSNHVKEKHANGFYREGVPKKIYYVETELSEYIDENKAAELIAQGVCFDSYPITMYAIDGRTIKVPEKQMSEYEKVGWFDSEPVLIYAPDGRTMYVSQSDVYEYTNVGWYNGKPVKCYNLHGERITIGENDYKEYKGISYFDTKSQAKYAYEHTAWGQGW